MSVVISGTVAQNNLTGSELIFTDTGTGYGTITSRTLTVYDSNGVIVGTPYSMGLSLTQLIEITADAFFTFTLVVVDNTGTYTVSVIFVAQGFYTAEFLEILASLGCDCNCGDIDNLIKGEIYLAGSQRFAMSNQGPASNAAIIAANTYVNNPF